MSFIIKLGTVFLLGGFLSMFLVVPFLILWYAIAEACRFDREMEKAEQEERELCNVVPLSLERRAQMFVGGKFNRG